MDIFKLECGIFYRILHLITCFLQFINVIHFIWDFFLWWVVTLMVCIGICNKLSLYRVITHPDKWSYQVFGLLCKSLIVMWMIILQKDNKVSHKSICSTTTNMRLA